jgi:hypothetical protein
MAEELTLEEHTAAKRTLSMLRSDRDALLTPEEPHCPICLQLIPIIGYGDRGEGIYRCSRHGDWEQLRLTPSLETSYQRAGAVARPVVSSYLVEKHCTPTLWRRKYHPCQSG